jgi:broad specificity phosphatase PhoE
MYKTHSLNLTIVRHGETQGNVNRKFEGITDSPLNEKGRYQAECTGKFLKNENFDIVFTSDLKRASETASIIVKENLNMWKHNNNFVELPILREINMGVLEGVSFKEYDNVRTKEGTAWYEFTPKGGESTADVKNRCKAFMERICDIYPSCSKTIPRILVVAHGLVIAQLLNVIYEETKCSGMPVGEVQNAFTELNDGISLLRMSNTAITRVDIEVEEPKKEMKSAKCDVYKSKNHLLNNVAINSML